MVGLVGSPRPAQRSGLQGPKRETDPRAGLSMQGREERMRGVVTSRRILNSQEQPRPSPGPVMWLLHGSTWQLCWFCPGQTDLI